MENKTRQSAFFRISIRPWGLILAAGVVAGAASVLGFFGACHWLLDLCSHFRVQYFFGLSGVALLLLIPRQRRAASFFGALAALNLGMILPLYLGSPPQPSSGETPIRAMLINVNTKSGKAARVADALRRFNPDIIVLEEVSTKWLAELSPVLADYSHSQAEPREDNFGIALYSRFPFTESRIAYIGEAEVPSVIAEIETPRGRCTLLATHPLPPAGGTYSRLRNGQLAELPKQIRPATSPVLLLGDLNVSPWSSHFRRLLRESGLKDSSQGRGVQPTWPTFSPLLLIPIDHCLHSPQIAIFKKQVGPSVGSDHYPVIVDFLVRIDKGQQRAEGNQQFSL